MSLAKVIEVIAEGDTIEKAMQNAVKQATETVNNIKSINCENIQGMVSNNDIEKYRVNAKVTFVVDKA
jgi:flavin-binding protein dodecin